MVLGTYVLLYLMYAAYLFMFADEGSLPPRWRIPDVPSEAQVIRETKECGSGGCWRQVVVQPERGQTPEDLARELDLSEEGQRHGWQWYDPHSVWIGASVDDGDLVITAGY